jgi:uncharacterized repeat protein (TIGR01451 family)
LGAIAIAQGQLTGQKPVVEQKQTPAQPAGTKQSKSLNPIPDSDAPPEPASPATAMIPPQRFAALPEAPAGAVEEGTSTIRVQPASAPMVVRGNDESPAPPPAEFSIQDAPSFDFDPNTLPEVPAGPQFDPPSTYSTPPVEATGQASPAEPPAAIESAGPESASGPVAEPPAQLDHRLRDAARSAVADSQSPSSIYGSAASDDALLLSPAPGSVYGGSADTSPSPVGESIDGEPGSQLAAPEPVAPPSQLATAPARDDSPAGFAAPAAAAAAAGGFAASVGDASDAEPVVSMQSVPQTEIASGSPGNIQQAGSEGDGMPGPDTLDGRQAPSLTVEKIAPDEIQVGKETSFQVRIRNVGQVAAHDLVVLDRVPRGTRFVNASPEANEAPDGQLMWQLGSLEPGDETTVTLNVLPVAEGEVGSVAQVLFQTHASVRTICTRPELTVQHTGPQKVLIGETVVLDITLANPGTGAATGVILEENVPAGLAHAAGQELEYEVGTLKPGESRRLQLTLKADQPGTIENSLIVRGDGNLIAEDSISLEVIAPSLEVSLSGPKLRYLEREATYEVAVSNPGTAAAREIELVTYLPKGMKFVSADHKGQYEPQNHAVYWSLEELPPRETGVAKLTLLPLETGEQKLSVEGRGELGLEHSSEKLVRVESQAELQFTIADEQDPIEVGSETSYVVTLTNRGSSAATEIRVLVGLPPELKPVGGDGPTKVAIEGTQVTIDPLARLGPGEQAQYKLRVRGLVAGPQRFQLQLVSNETPVPVTKEEITRVYADR